MHTHHTSLPVYSNESTLEHFRDAKTATSKDVSQPQQKTHCHGDFHEQEVRWAYVNR